MSGVLARLKQRKLVQWALAYIAATFALIQVLDVVAGSYDWPHSAMHIVFGLLALGFVVTLVLAWYHGEKGRQRVSGPELLLIALVLTIGGGLLWRFAPVSSVNGNALVAKASNSAAARSPDAAQRTAGSIVPESAAGAASSGLPNTRASAAAQAVPIPAKSVAVLPFVNESGDKDQQYFSDGLSEDLITALSQFGGLKVINRDSSFRFRNSQDGVKTIAAKLGVAHLLEGSVQRAGNEVRISAELVNASDGSTLWSQRYDKPYKDLFALQDAITKSVADALKAKLLDTGNGAVVQSDRPPSGNLAAYNAYQQGQFYFQRGSEADLHEALSQFAKAVRLDPDYAAAYARTSRAWTVLAGYFFDLSDKPHAYAEARAAADNALRLDPDLAESHLEKGAVLVNADFDWNGARAEYQHALKLAPESADAYFSLSTSEAELGHPESAIELDQRALAGNPLNAFWHDWLASYLGALGRFAEAETAARTSVTLEPQQPLSYRELAYIEVLKGDTKAALAAAQSVPTGRNRNIAMAWALQLGSDRVAADAALQELIAKHAGDSSYQIAEVYALRRDPDNMFKWLDQAWSNRDNGIQYLLYDPIILRYKNDPRFAAFCKKAGLPTTTDAKALP